MKIISRHIQDWCHLCGNRESHLTDIWYPNNAEHGGPNDKYIRICSKCSNDIVQTAGADRLPQNQDEVHNCVTCGHKCVT